MFVRLYINWKTLLHPLRSGGIIHPLKNYYLRKKNGAGCCDIFSLCDYLGKKILPALKEFRRRCGGHPYAYVNNKTKEEMTGEKWEEILDKMIYAFEAMELNNNGKDVDYKKQQEGFVLFGKWFHSLWF